MHLHQSLFIVLLYCSYLNARERYQIVVISLDGCRWDYLSRGELPAMTVLRKDGVSADWAQGIFPTKTFPSHNTIITGN